MDENISYLRVLKVIVENTTCKKNMTLYLSNFQALNCTNQLKLLEYFYKELNKDFQNRNIRVIFSILNISPDSQVYNYFYKNLRSGVLVIPDLNLRKSDISVIFEHFLIYYSEDGKMPQISDSFYMILEKNSWVGNVRSLRAAAAYLSINNTSGIIPDIELEEYLEDTPINMTKTKETKTSPRQLGAFEADYIYEILKSVNGNISKAARQLGITRNTIKSKLKKAEGILTDNLVLLKA
jgi:arginine utilization regulatory protein